MTPVRRLGFTGTRHGMQRDQHHAVMDLVRKLEPEEAHHGDCVGADMEFHEIVRVVQREAIIHIHPPFKREHRAFCLGDEIHPEKDYLIRNQDIVKSSDAMVAAPRRNQEELRSGTWATIRYARKVGKPVFIVGPDGKFVEFDC